MLKQSQILLAITLLFAPILLLAADDSTRPVTNKAKLEQLSLSYAEKVKSGQTEKYFNLLRSSNAPQLRLNNNPDIQLMYMKKSGRPVYYATDNLAAARTISTDDVWPGGSGGFSLSGLGTSQGKLGVWDAGRVLLTHQEFGGRVAQVDGAPTTHYHSTHVAGTMVASGFQANAKGMSYEAYLNAYDWNSDDAEMAAAGATGMNVSSHSYGSITGWRYDDGSWYWWGDTFVSTVEDYGFGFYGYGAQAWDNIAYNAPYFLICKSAGNDRDDNGPGAGGGHYVWVGSDWAWSTETRDPDGTYDCIPWYGNAKNIMTVGAVNDYANGYNGPSSVVMSSFSGWGPSDDGRIKPDIVANGVGLYSATDAGNTLYISISGTSMSTPNVSGSVNLLFRHYEATHGTITPLASTVKALVLHTADEAGPNPGPDYRYGWGLMNTLKAANLITGDMTETEIINETSLLDGESDLYQISSDGTFPLRATIVWTDPPGTPPPPSLDPVTPMLVNDLDIRIEFTSSGTIFEPYYMDASISRTQAQIGDNVVDNVEQIYIDLPAVGDYELTVSHKGTLASEQWYSLIITSQDIKCFDSDNDGYGNPEHLDNTCLADNCPVTFNPDQDDVDADDVGTVCDNCPDKANSGQEDADDDDIGDACDYICGDANDDGAINILDIIFMINNSYKNGDDPTYPQSMDVNFDSIFNILDIIYLINTMYKDGIGPVCE